MTAWKPAPGSPASRAVELLRFLPTGTAMPTPELRKRADITERGSLHIHLQKATSHRLLRAEKREDGDKLRTYWMAGARPAA